MSITSVGAGVQPLPIAHAAVQAHAAEPAASRNVQHARPVRHHKAVKPLIAHASVKTPAKAHTALNRLA